MEHEKLKSEIIKLIVERTISGKEIDQIFNISDRQRKSIIEDLVVNDGWRIITSKVKPYGYKIAKNDEELIECCERYKREAIALFRRAKILRHQVGMKETLFGQEFIIEGELEKELECMI